MREMKDSGMDWIGKVPIESSIIKFKYLIKQTNAGEVIDKSFWYNGNELLYTCQRTPIMSDYVGFPNDKRTRSGDLLLTRNATPYVFIPKENSIYSNVVQRVHLEDEYDARYVSYSILCGAEALIVNGDTIPSYNMEVWKNISILNFTKSEQERRANYLDSKCFKIDFIIEKQQEIIDKLKEYKLSVITEAVTKGLNPDAEMKDSGVEWFGEIANDFEIRKLKYLCSKITDGSHFSPEVVENGFPYITASDIHGKGINYRETKKISSEDYKILVGQGCKPEKNDVLLVKDGATTGRVGLMTDEEECVLLSSVAMLRPCSDVVSGYLMYLLMSTGLQQQISLSMAGSAMPRTTLTKLMKYYGIFAPYEIQIMITSYLDEKCSLIDNVINDKELTISKLQQYKKSLIYEVVTGKKEV